MGKISVETKDIFPVIKKFLYSDHEIFIREIVSNGIDACLKAQAIRESETDSNERISYFVNVTIDKEKNTITVSDDGIGMSKSDVEKYINQIAFSGATDFLEKYKDTNNIIGHFGLGFYSTFMVSDKVHIYSRYMKDDKTQGCHWECDGTIDYILEDYTKDKLGTDIVMEISPEFREMYLDFDNLKAILQKYSRFSPIEINLRCGDKFATITDLKPIWLNKPSTLEDKDYLDFYHKMYPGSADPAFWIHLNIDFPFSLTGILYFPIVNNQVDIKRNKVYLYSNNVFVTDHVVDILPDYLTLLHGVIDSNTIPLNVSRSYLQSDNNVKKISKYISKKVADKLKELINKDRTKYESIWDKIKVFINYGMLTQDDFYNKIKSAYLFKTTEDEYYTISEYHELVKDTQKSKDSSVVYLYATDLTMQYRYIKDAVAKGYKVIYLNDNLTTPLINMLEHKADNNNYKLIRVDSDVLSNIIVSNENKVEDKYTREEKDLIGYVFSQKRPIDKDFDIMVNVWENSDNDRPCEVTADETVRRLKDIELQGAAGQLSFGGMKYRCTLNINLNNKAVKKLADTLINDIGEEFNKNANKLRSNNEQITKLQNIGIDSSTGENNNKDAIEKLQKENAELATQAQNIALNYKDKDDEIAQLFDLGLLEVGLLNGESMQQFIERSAKFL